MGIVLFVMGAVVAVVLSMLVGGLLLPRAHDVTRVLRLRAAPDVVWSLIAEPAAYPTWRDTMSSVDIESTAPLRWREFGDDGSLAFEAVRVNAPQHFAARLLDDDVARHLEREFTLEPDSAGTRVVYRERSTVHNPIARFVNRYIVRRTGASDRLLVALAMALGEQAQPDDA